MARCLRISHDAGPGFRLHVPSPDVSAADLATCVRQRLALGPLQPLFFTLEEPRPEPGAAADIVPLSSALPDGTHLRLHTGPPRQVSEPEVQVNPGALSVGEASFRPQNEQALLEGSGRPRSRCCRCIQEPTDLPPMKEITTDLANERTLLAWVRTSLAVIRTVFSFATFKGLTKGQEAMDVFVTVLLALAAFASLLVGWQRWAVVRMHGPLAPRRLSIWPLLTTFAVVAGVCCLSTVLQSPRRLHPDLASAEPVMSALEGHGWIGD